MSGFSLRYSGLFSGGLWDLFTWLRRVVAYRYYRSILNKFSPALYSENHVIADVGCGLGHFSYLAHTWWPICLVVSIDYCYDTLVSAYRLSHLSTYVNSNAQFLPLLANSVDIVVALHVVEHLPVPETFFAGAHRSLRPNGLLLVATPNPVGVCARVMGRAWHGYYPDHISLKPPADWRLLIKDAGFEPLLERTTGLTGLPAFRRFPLAVLNWTALASFGAFPWRHGEAYISLWSKPERGPQHDSE
jgi:2-polyprenyl-3-methyl-5-hydroxy-6-metoxy-1,4-benzoquinol methylase